MYVLSYLCPFSLQYLPCNVEHWVDGILLVCDSLTTDEGGVILSILKFVLSFVTSLKTNAINNVSMYYKAAVLTCRYVCQRTYCSTIMFQYSLF